MARIALELGGALKARPAGVARYSTQLAAELLRCPQGHELELWYPRRRRLRGHLRLPESLAHWYGPRLPDQGAPQIMHATECKFPRWQSTIEVATVHDLYNLQDASTLAPDIVASRSAYIRRAHFLIGVSHTTRQQLHGILGIPESRTAAIPLAVDERFRPASAQEQAALRQRHKLPAEFLLFMGQARVNKNLDRLIRAYARSKLPLPLLIAGKQKRELRRQLQAVVREAGQSDSVRMLGYLPDEELPALLSCASGFCFPSTFEGFGLPLLEAMACGTPVLTSRGIVTEEVAGGFAELVDPHDEADMAAGLQRLVERKGQVDPRSIAFATRNRWQDVAAQTMAVYQRLLADSPAA